MVRIGYHPADIPLVIVIGPGMCMMMMMKMMMMKMVMLKSLNMLSLITSQYPR